MRLTGRRLVLTALGAATLCVAYPAAAQRRPRRIGYLSGAIPAITTPMLAGFRAGMAQHGWLEGRDYVIEARHAAGVQTAVPGLAESLLATGPDVLLSTGEDTVRQLADRTKTIPIVMTVALDPVGYGLVRSLQRPGGNVTGVVVLTNDLGAKRLQLLKEVFPRVNHVGVLFEPKSRVSTAQLEPI